MKREYPKMQELPVIEQLPDVLGGVKTAEEWNDRREEIKDLIAHYMLGHRPENDAPARGEVLTSREIYGGKALREGVRIHFNDQESFDIYVVRPADGQKHPTVVWNYFQGRDACPIEEELLERGYALAAFENNSVCVDNADAPESPAKRAYPEADWGAIMIWGWGFSKIIDYLLTTDYVDPARLLVSGHSRNGKAALAAAAYDERVAMAIVNNSGCGGAGCYRFLGDATHTTQDSEKVESVGTITHVFPHWFAPELSTFGGQEKPYPVTNENRLPFDLHFLKALVAPRVLYTNEGTEDVWANTHGSVLTREAAQPVFDLLGVPGHNVQTIRDGGHGQEARDWRLALDIADRLLG